MSRFYKNNVLSVLLLAAFSLLISTDTSFAYIDPGSGSMILQVLIASILGILTAVKIYWHKIKSYFSKSSDSNITEDNKK